LIERLAEHHHAVWARQRLPDGWRYGPEWDDDRKLHPALVPYAELPEAEKEYGRDEVRETLKIILALGYRIVTP
jgi:hypothetical protein